MTEQVLPESIFFFDISRYTFPSLAFLTHPVCAIEKDIEMEKKKNKSPFVSVIEVFITQGQGEHAELTQEVDGIKSTTFQLPKHAPILVNN